MKFLIAVLLLLAVAQSVPAQGVRYYYDDLGRLVSVIDPNGNSATYSYDAVGNLLSITRSTGTATGLAIYNATPQQAEPGQQVTIQGQGFSATPAANALRFNGVAASVTSSTANTLVATVPPTATTGLLSVTVGSATATGPVFTVLPHLVVSPATASVALGNTQKFAASDVFGDGTSQDVTTSGVWSSSNPVVASISNSVGTKGQATSLALGTSTITASVGLRMASATLTVTAAVPVSLSISPINPSEVLGNSGQFTATLTFSDATTQNVTASAAWSSSATTVAIISNTAGTQGVAYTLGVGTTTITATQGTFTASTTLTVTPASSGQISRFAYISNYDGTISIYSINPNTGDLRPAGYATYRLVNQASNFIYGYTGAVADPFSRFLYVGSLVDNHTPPAFPDNIWGFQINAGNGALSPMSGSPFPVPLAPQSTITSFSPGFSIDPLAHFLYYTLNGYSKIDPTTGNLTPFTPSNGCYASLTGTTTMHPSGKFLYEVGAQSNICGFSIDPATGMLTNMPASPFKIALSNNISATVAVDPTGKFAYAGGNGLNAYTVDSTSGALSLIATYPETASSTVIEVVVDPQGKFVYAFDDGAKPPAGQVWAYTINATTGALTLVPGSPFSSRLDPPPAPASVYPLANLATEPSGKFLYIVNEDLNYISVMSIDGLTGALTLLKVIDARGNPNTMAIAKGGAPVTYTPKFAYTANSGSNNISGYTIDPASGSLTAVSVSPFPSGAKPSSIAVDPAGKFAYAVNTTDGTISVYSVNATTGALTQVGSPVAEGQVGPAGLTIDPSGRFLYIVNTNAAGSQGSVSAYLINSSTGALTPVAGSPFPAGTNPVTMSMDPQGQFLIVANADASNILAFSISPLDVPAGSALPVSTAGALTPIGSALIAGTKPSAIAVHPSARFFYVANAASGDISLFNVKRTRPYNSSFISFTFALNSSTPVGATTNLQSATIEPNGKYLYVAGGPAGVAGSLWAYSINAITGALTLVNGSPVAVGTNPTSVTVDISGQYVSVANTGSNNVSVFKIDPVTGALTAVPGSPFAAGTAPGAITTTGTIQ